MQDNSETHVSKQIQIDDNNDWINEEIASDAITNGTQFVSHDGYDVQAYQEALQAYPRLEQAVTAHSATLATADALMRDVFFSLYKAVPKIFENKTASEAYSIKSYSQKGVLRMATTKKVTSAQLELMLDMVRYRKFVIRDLRTGASCLSKPYLDGFTNYGVRLSTFEALCKAGLLQQTEPVINSSGTFYRYNVSEDGLAVIAANKEEVSK